MIKFINWLQKNQFNCYQWTSPYPPPDPSHTAEVPDAGHTMPSCRERGCHSAVGTRSLENILIASSRPQNCLAQSLQEPWWKPQAAGGHLTMWERSLGPAAAQWCRVRGVSPTSWDSGQGGSYTELLKAGNMWTGSKCVESWKGEWMGSYHHENLKDDLIGCPLASCPNTRKRIR